MEVSNPAFDVYEQRFSFICEEKGCFMYLRGSDSAGLSLDYAITYITSKATSENSRATMKEMVRLRFYQCFKYFKFIENIKTVRWLKQQCMCNESSEDYLATRIVPAIYLFVVIFGIFGNILVLLLSFKIGIRTVGKVRIQSKLFSKL